MRTSGRKQDNIPIVGLIEESRQEVEFRDHVRVVYKPSVCDVKELNRGNGEELSKGGEMEKR